MRVVLLSSLDGLARTVQPVGRATGAHVEAPLVLLQGLHISRLTSGGAPACLFLIWLPGIPATMGSPWPLGTHSWLDKSFYIRGPLFLQPSWPGAAMSVDMEQLRATVSLAFVSRIFFCFENIRHEHYGSVRCLQKRILNQQDVAVQSAEASRGMYRL